MKVLFPAVTCVLTSHMKPTLGEAIASVLGQTRLDIQLLVLDSGQWIGRDGVIESALKDAYNQYSGHPLIEWITTGEGPSLISRKCPVAYVTNEAIRSRLIRGRYMCTFYDDDLYYPQFMEKMAGYLDTHSDADAVHCSEHRINLNANGTISRRGTLYANGPRDGAQLDCAVDGAQVMWRRAVLTRIGDPWLPEDPDNTSCRHSDGIFLNKLGVACGTVWNIPEVLVEHRFTQWSTYTKPS